MTKYLPLLALSLLLTFAGSVEARASEQSGTYRACLKFLRLSPAQQKKVARGTDYSLEEILLRCRQALKRGPGTPSQPRKKDPGYCFPNSLCEGPGTHVDDRRLCPSESITFYPDSGIGLCSYL